MQRDSNPVLEVPSSGFRVPGSGRIEPLNRGRDALPRVQADRQVGPTTLVGRGQSLLISPDARHFICLQRPELAPDFEVIGDLASIPIASLLRPGPSRFVPSSGFRVPGSINTELGTRNSELSFGLGDLLAALLHRLRIDAAVALLQRHGWLAAECGCAARRARLNALTPRLRSLLEPWPLTLAVVVSWLLFAVVLLAR